MRKLGSNQAEALTVAIDGPAGAGKSTVARAVAKRLNIVYVDTGAMYRAVALKCLRESIDIRDARAVERVAKAADVRLAPGEGGRLEVYLDGEDVTEAIRQPAVGEAVSVVSAVPAVREVLVAAQRRMAKEGGVVMDGRDIGTVVLPDADVKVFLTASLEERARRRHRELVAQGVTATLEEVMVSIRERDERDSSRAFSPLRRAEDAVLIDTTGKPVEQVVAEILALCEGRGPGGRHSGA